MSQILKIFVEMTKRNLFRVDLGIYSGSFKDRGRKNLQKLLEYVFEALLANLQNWFSV